MTFVGSAATLHSVRKVSTLVERSPLWCLQVLSREIALETDSSAFRLSIFGLSVSRLSAHVCRQGCNWGVRHAPRPQGHQEVWHWWGTVVLKGTLSKWMWRMRPAMVATFAMRPYGHFSAFSNWSSSSKPSWGSGWLSPLLMMTREKIWKTCEMSFSTCTLAQHCRVQ